MKTRLISLTLTLAALLASGALAHANTTGLPGPGATPATNPPIAWADLGANATVQYSGDGLAVASTADGAVRLRCAFQKLEGEVTREGLWLNSTVPGAASRFRLVAAGLGRAGGATVALPENGVVAQDKQMARFTRPGLTEEYSVSVDGVRQDFVVAAPPGGTGDLRVELAVDGATVEALPGPDQPNAGSVGRVPSRGADGTEAGDAGSGDPAYTESVGRVPSRGARLTLDGSGRKLAYSRLRVTDATGKELAARMEVTPKSEIRNPKSEMALAVVVDDAAAVYPVRIDPTFSDANWVSLDGLPGANSTVFATLVDSTGILYVGGSFTVIGTVTANRIAKWDGSAWSALDAGLDGQVNALVLSGADLYAGGAFTTTQGGAANALPYIAKWNGSTWSALGAGLNNTVNALAVASDGTLYAGGTFTYATNAGPPDVLVTRIAKWDGNAWSSVGAGLNNAVYALAVSGSVLYAGGLFTTTVGGAPNALPNIAKWNGTAWSTLGTGLDSTVYALAVSGSVLYAGGDFSTTYGGTAYALPFIAKWNGTAWSSVGVGLGSIVNALAVSGTDLYAGGNFSRATNAGPTPVSAFRVAKWNGTAWSSVGGGLNTTVRALAVSPTGDLYVGGDFASATNAGPTSVVTRYLAKWSGAAWSSLGTGMDGQVNALVASGTDLYVGGGFTVMPGGVSAFRVAKWDGSAWSALGAGLNSLVWTLAVSGTDLYAGGSFTATAGGTANTLPRIAKWNGTAWVALGAGLNNSVSALAVSGTDLYAGGSFTTTFGGAANALPRIAKWNGTAWVALGAGLNNSVSALAVSGADLYAAGNFTSTYGGAANALVFIAKWNGSTWSSVGPGLGSSVYALAVSGTDLYAGGAFTSTYGGAANALPCIAKWNGTAWVALGAGLNSSVSALAVSGTDLYAGGAFTTTYGGTANALPRIAKWDGSAWSALGSGMNNTVSALAVYGTELYAGGSFMTAGGKVSPYLAKATPPTGTDTTTTLGSSLNPSTYGASVTFTATVAPSAASGTVTFKDGATTLGTGTLSNGTATYTTTALTAGAHSITAEYAGDASYNSSTSSPLTQTVNQATPTATLAVNNSPVTYDGTAKAATVGVTASSTPGSVANIQTGGAASQTASGTYAVTADFVPADTNYATLTAQAAGNFVIGKVTTTSTLASSLNPSTYGSSVTFTSTVSPSAASGTVTFKDGGATLGTGTLSGGLAIFATNGLTAGSHSLTAEYSGSAAYLTSTSSVLTQVVVPASTPPAITTQPVSAVVTVGQPASLSVTNTGTAPFGYQWLKDGVMLAGQTNPTLSFALFQFTNSGSYSVVVTNASGLAISFPASLSVPDAPLQAWGYNASGQLGNGTLVSTIRPINVASNVVAVAAGGSHSLLVQADGTLWAMGYNNRGQLGNGTVVDTNRPVSVASNVVAVAAGNFHSLLVKAGGTLWAMGYNGRGQLGIGNSTSTNRAVSVASNVVAVAAGYNHSLFVQADGTLWAMGDNGEGQLGIGNSTSINRAVSVASNVVAVAAGHYHTLFVQADGTLWAMGDNSSGQLGNGTAIATNLPVSVASNVVAVAAGDYHSLFVKADGTLWVMGRNNYGQLGNGNGINTNRPVSVASNVVAVAAGFNHSLWVHADGTLWVMGRNNYGQLGDGTVISTNRPVQVAGLTVASLGAMDQANHSLAVGVLAPQAAALTNQTIPFGQSFTFTLIVTNGDGPFTYQWQLNGTNLAGATNATYTLASAALTDAGSYAVVISSAYGSTTSASATLTVNPPTPPTITTQPVSAVVTVGQPASLSVTNTGTAPFGYQWLKDGVMLPGQTNATLTYASFQFTNSGSYSVVVTNASGLAISFPASLSVSNAPLQAWGNNANGQLGNGSNTQLIRPASVASNVVAMAGGYNHTLLVQADGTLWAMGINAYGQLGNGTTTDTNRPVSVATNVVAVAGGGYHSLFVRADGTLWAAGRNNSGQLGNGTTTDTNQPVSVASNVVAVAAGDWHSLFVQANGTLWAMGANDHGQLGNGNYIGKTRPVSVASNVVAVAVGGVHSLFVQADGTLWTMGRNFYGQLGDGTTTSANRPVSVASNVVAVAGGTYHSLFVQADGSLWAMGANSFGQLGIGNNTNTNRPVSVASNVVAVAGGGAHSLFVQADGSLWAMGNNSFGQLGNGSYTAANRPVAVSAVLVASLAPQSVASHSLAVAARILTATTTALASGSNPSAYGSGVTFTATVSPSAASGTVTFKEGATTLRTATLSGGVASFATNGLTAGAHSLTAEYSGDASYAASTNSGLTQTVNKATPTATLAVNNSPVTYNGSAKSATVTVSASSTPGAAANILTGGAASQTASGTYAVTADFVPTDTNYNTLTAQSAGNFVISQATPTATLAVNNSPVTYNGTAKSATVGVSASSTPGAAANILTGGAASQTASGTHAVTADFVPTDTNYTTLTAQAAGNFVISKATPSVTTWPTASDLTEGQALSASTLTGGSASVAGSFAWELPATVPPAGTASQSAVFSPTDAANYLSVTGAVSVTVTASGAVTVLDNITGRPVVSAATWSIKDTRIMAAVFTVTTNTSVGFIQLTGASVWQKTMSGSVNTALRFILYDVTGGNLPQTPLAQFDGASATVTTTLARFDYTFGAPLSDYQLQAGHTYALGVTAPSYTGSELRVAVPSDSPAYTVAPDYAWVQTARFSELNIPPLTWAVPGGEARFALRVTATELPKEASTTAVASSLNPSTHGSSVTFTSTVSPSAASGAVTFKDGTTTLGTGTLNGGVATFATSSLTAGSHSLTAEYAGDASYLASTSSVLTQVVNPAGPVTHTAINSGLWSDPATWSDGVVPAAGDDVVIPVGFTVTLDSNTAAIGNLTVAGTLTVPGAQTLTLSGNYTNTGTFNPGTGTVALSGGADQTLAATAPGTLTFYRLTVNKAPATAIVTAASKLKATKKLALTAGKLVSASDYGDIEIGMDGELQLTSDITISGDFINWGTLTTDGHGITFDGGVEQDLTLYSLTTFDDLTVAAGTTLIETESDDSALVNGTLLNQGVIRKLQPVTGMKPYYFGLAGRYNSADMEINVTLLSGFPKGPADPLTALQVDRIDANHPSAPGTNTTALYWTITATGSEFIADLTLPHAGLATPLACRFTNPGWDGAASSFTTATVTRTGLTAFSDWAVFNNVDAPLAAVTGHLYYDTNGDGNQDLGEPDLPLVTVTVTVGATIESAITDAAGNWSTTVPPGAGTADVATGGPNFLSQVPAGWVQTEGTDPTAFTGVAGETTDAGKDGYYAAATLGDRVWLDENADGVQDAGEAGLANVRVELYGFSAVVPTGVGGTYLLTNTVTDSEGGYLFRNLPAGIYQLKIVASSLPGGLLANPTFDRDGTNTANTATVTLLPGGRVRDADFGYDWSPPADVFGDLGFGTIGDRVWVDADGDGWQTPGEPGLGGVTLSLYELGPDVLPDTADDVLLTSTVTALDGTYSFDDVAPGAYRVAVTAGIDPALYLPTTDPDSWLPISGGVEDTDEQTTWPIIVAPGDVYVNADFGYEPASAQANEVDGYIYFDTDGDGTSEDSDGDWEPGTPSVSVALIRDLDGNGSLAAGEPIVATALSDESGYWRFAGLPDGHYLVWVNDVRGVLARLTLSGDPEGPLDGWAAVDLDSAGSEDGIYAYDQDFGYTPAGHGPGLGLVHGAVFVTLNDQSFQETGDGAEGVVVYLFDGNHDQLLATTVTDRNGHYAFGGLELCQSQPKGQLGGGPSNPGEYWVVVEPKTLPGTPGQLTISYDPDGNPDGSPLDNETFVTVCSGGEVIGGQDFAYGAVTPNLIFGRIWEDINANGRLDGDEDYYGLSDVTVELRDALSGNVVAVRTTSSDGNNFGEYAFPNLPDGSYVVVVTDEANWLEGMWHSVAEGNKGHSYRQFELPDACRESRPNPCVITVSGGVNTCASFGYYGNTTVLGDWVWLDENCNGIQDEDVEGNFGLPGVAVTLSLTNANGSYATVKTKTDDWGNYFFANFLLDENHRGVMPDGPPDGSPSTWLALVLPLGYTPTTQDATNEDADSDNPDGELATPRKGLWNDSYDFGFCGFAAVSSLVWNDQNADGIYQPDGPDGIPGNADDELGVADVRVELWFDADGDGDPETLKADGWTDADGLYAFANLPSGYFRLVIPTSNFDTGEFPGALALTPFSSHFANQPGVDNVGTQLDGEATEAVSPVFTLGGGGKGHPANFTLGAAKGPGMSFGFTSQPPQQGTVYGHLYHDANDSGTQDGAEPNLANVTVWLTNSVGGVTSADTDADGWWTNSAPAGTATVKVDTSDVDFTSVVPLGWRQTQGTDPMDVTVLVSGTVSGGTNGYFWAAPAITCAPAKTVECGIAWTFDPPTYTNGTCGAASLSILSTVTNVSGACGGTFVATRTWSLTDACGASLNCSQIVTLTDTTPPVLTCAPPRTNECTAVWSFDPPTATDACGGTPTLAVLSTVTNGGCGGSFTATRTWSATDGCGNSNVCSQTVYGLDTTPPDITCSPAKSVACDSVWSFDAPTATDQVVFDTLIYDNTVYDLTNRFNPGTVEVGDEIILAAAPRLASRFSFEFWGHNTVQTSFEGNVQVRLRFYRNDGPPTNSAATPGTVLFDSGSFPIPALPRALLMYEDFVTDAVVPLVGPLPDVFTWSVQFSGLSANDSAGIVLYSPPVVGNSYTDYWAYLSGAWNLLRDSTLPMDFSAKLEAVSEGAVIATLSTVTNAGCGASYTATRTWTATDACGNIANCSQQVSVLDTVPPTLNGVPGAATVDCNSVPPPPVVTATDNCDVPPTVSYAQVELPGATVYGYQLQRTWWAIDGCDNAVTNSQVITVQNCAAAIGNLVWEDWDNDGLRDAGELGLANVRVELWRDLDTNSIYEPATGDLQVPLDTLTLADGTYGFAGLAPGNYFVVIPTPPVNHTLCSTHSTGLDNQVDDDNNGQQPGGQGTVTFSPAIQLDLGETDNTVDFGFTDPGIGNLVWADLNHDGSVDTGEPGISNVVVQLYGTNAASGTNFVLLLQTTTDTNGYYVFQTLAPNSYYVKLPAANFASGGALAHYRLTALPVSEDNQVDDDNNGLQTALGGDVDSPLIVLQSSQEPLDTGTETGRGRELDNGADEDADLTVDFGFYPLATLGNLVWNDADHDGSRTPGEAGLDGVIVALWNAGSNGLVGGGDDGLVSYTNTGGGGAYSFADLPVGNYYLAITNPPAAYPAVSPLVVAGDDGNKGQALGGLVVSAVFPLSAGSNEVAQDFGFYYLGQYVEGQVYQDNLMGGSVGMFDTNDTPLPSITVYVTNSVHGLVTVSTDGNGYFQAYVPAGDTVVNVDTNDVDFPHGLVLTSPPDGRNPWPVAGGVPLNGSVTHNVGFLRSSVTLASVLAVTAHTDSGVVTVQWVTVAEVATLSYDLQRQLPSGLWTTVNDEPVFAWNSITGATYDMVDAGARARQSYRYQLLEYVVNGDVRRHGPYDVTVSGQPGVPVALTGCQIAGGQLRLTWAGETGGQYLLERSLSLGADAQWTEVPLTTPANTSASVPAAASAEFFRVFRLP